jgi:MoxR-like ATPase
VVLIDEIDKADIDFPNDLLDVFDHFEFDIEDLPVEENDISIKKRGFGRHVAAPEDSVKPIIIITSNREKQLPEPFLRRCLYVQLGFPDDPKTLTEIVRRNLAVATDQISDKFIAEAVNQFRSIRQRAESLNMQKPPATSELVDWVRVLHWQQRKPGELASNQLTSADQAILFKIRQDIERYRARTDQEAGQ